MLPLNDRQLAPNFQLLGAQIVVCFAIDMSSAKQNWQKISYGKMTVTGSVKNCESSVCASDI